MSLDVYLTIEGAKATHDADADRIMIREDGSTKEITREEWDCRFPGREPIVISTSLEEDEVYSANITHNLNRMADAADIYKYLWRPGEIGITTAWELIDPLMAGLKRLKAEPDFFRTYNPDNGWGTYEGLVEFVEKYLDACKQHPDARVDVCR